MSIVPNVDPNLVRAAAYFTLWRTATPTTKVNVEGIVKQQIEQTPELRQALKQVAELYTRLQHSEKQPIPNEDRIPIPINDASIFFAMRQTNTHARALALVTLWRNSDALGRKLIEHMIRAEVQETLSFRRDLKQVLLQIEQYTMQEQNKDIFVML